MLAELRIRDFAIIDALLLRFHPGFNVLTGETGAGKSIILDALGLLLGDRASGEMIRAGRSRAEIEATFHLPSPTDRGLPPPTRERVEEIRALLEEEGLDDPDAPDQVVLGREVRSSGRHIARVNGRAVPLGLLARIAGRLVDIHGQGEHLGLLRERTHLHLLDRYAGLLPLRRRVADAVGRLQAVRDELARLHQDERTVAQRLDLLRFQVAEIEQARLEPGEEEALESERRRLANAESLIQWAQAAETILALGEGEIPSALDLVGEAVGRLERLARIDPELESLALQGQSLLEQLGELARALQDYAEGLEFDPQRLEEVEERLHLIADLKRKYGSSIPEVLAYGAQARAELETLDRREARTEELETQEDALLQEIGRLAAELSAAREEAGQRMAQAVEQELADLRMAQARFHVQVAQVEDPQGAYLPDGRRVAFDRTGIDRVAFLLSANPGEPLRPLARVASGGETARLMLALKSVLVHADATPTLIFDEIDQGIGGRVGAVVGAKLWRLTQAPAPEGPIRHQVICITHLPQLAAFADRHLRVEKQTYREDGRPRTRTQVVALEGDMRIQELMQMLGTQGEGGRRSVEEILAQVAAFRAAAPDTWTDDSRPTPSERTGQRTRP